MVRQLGIAGARLSRRKGVVIGHKAACAGPIAAAQIDHSEKQRPTIRNRKTHDNRGTNPKEFLLCSLPRRSVSNARFGSIAEP